MNRFLIDTTIQFAEYRERAYEKYLEKYCPDGIWMPEADKHYDSLEFVEYHTWEKALRVLLNGANYQDILDLEALMLLGRDGDGSFQNVRDDLAETYPHEDEKTMAVIYITEKSPLATYLSDGLKRMG